ncbi:hypothetical protein SAMN04488238_106216 [Roseicitreum antarcticum]|uniref:Uncharacterized protein n=1 Tax=Roseicitreum antarcticum TaxID=564137 RepID=A0A1H3A731_9RHOB|nr:hypothetical protein SAMN04488238_106216 [Roseicitreum antarcticum]
MLCMKGAAWQVSIARLFNGIRSCPQSACEEAFASFRENI